MRMKIRVRTNAVPGTAVTGVGIPSPIATQGQVDDNVVTSKLLPEVALSAWKVSRGHALKLSWQFVS